MRSNESFPLKLKNQVPKKSLSGEPNSKPVPNAHGDSGRKKKREAHEQGRRGERQQLNARKSALYFGRIGKGRPLLERKEKIL